MGDLDRRLAIVERWFTRRGTPHLIEDYSATHDVFTRMVPVLTLLAIVEVAGALDADFRWWQNVLAGVGGLALLVTIWAAANAARGRPRFQRPDHVGAVEVATFVLGPALITLVINGEVARALSLAVANAALLGLTYVVTSYGVIPLSRWALGKTARELGAVAGLLGRALPLLLLIQIVLFINAEVWQVSAGFDGVSLAASCGLFVAIGLAFLLTRLPREISRLATFADEGELAAAVAGTPAEALAEDLAVVSPGSLGAAPLSRRQRANLMLVALFSQGIQVILVTVIIGAFFVVFGVLTLTPEVVEGWVGHPADEVLRLDLDSRELLVTAELLKLSAFLAAFSGLYFTVVLVADSTYREEFFDEILTELRQTLAVRALYLRARSTGDDRATPAP